MHRERREPTSAPHVPSTYSENFRLVLPLFFLAAASFVISYFLFSYSAAIHPTRVPLWLLSMSMGVIAATGASTGLLFGDFSDEPERIEVASADLEHFVLVPRADWEQIQAARVLSSFGRPPAPSDDPLAPWLESPTGASELPAPKQIPSTMPTGAVSATTSPETAPLEASAPKARPIWAEGVPDPVARTRTRSADQLAAQVDELLRDLDVMSEAKPEPARPPIVPAKATPPSPSTDPHRATLETATPRRRAAASKTVAGVPLGAAISAADVTDESTQAVRDEYESLLAQLRNEAEQSTQAPRSSSELLCSSCRRRMDVQEHWESCPTCWRVFCPSCLARTRVMGEPWFCPTCRSRPT